MILLPEFNSIFPSVISVSITSFVHNRPATSNGVNPA